MIGFPERFSSRMPQIRETSVFTLRMYLDVSPQYERSSFTASSVKLNNDSVNCNAPSCQQNYIDDHKQQEKTPTLTKVT